MARRKSDKYKIKENRSKGTGNSYEPWIKVHEFGSKGRSTKIVGWKHNRIHHFLSDLELYYFLVLQWEENVIEIREQYPLLPLHQTIFLADELGYAHPPRSRKEKTILTTDFLIFIREGKQIKKIARTVKTLKDLYNPRTLEKFMIEKNYWDIKEVDWLVITEKDIPRVKAQNIYRIYNAYFWNTLNHVDTYTKNCLTSQFLNVLINNDYQVIETTNEFDSKKNWQPGQSLAFFQFLLTRKILLADLDVKFNFHSMNVWINEGVATC